MSSADSDSFLRSLLNFGGEKPRTKEDDEKSEIDHQSKGTAASTTTGTEGSLDQWMKQLGFADPLTTSSSTPTPLTSEPTYPSTITSQTLYPSVDPQSLNTFTPGVGGEYGGFDNYLSSGTFRSDSPLGSSTPPPPPAAPAPSLPSYASPSLLDPYASFTSSDPFASLVSGSGGTFPGYTQNYSSSSTNQASGTSLTAFAGNFISSLPLPVTDPSSASQLVPKTGKDAVYTFVEDDFDIRSMYRNSPIAFIGGIRSGKSVLISYILRVQKFKRVAAFLGGSDAKTFYSHFIPDIYIHEYSRRPWDSVALEIILEHQDLIHNLKEDQFLKDEMKDVDIELCLIFEDLAFTELFRTDETFFRLVSNTRRLQICSLFSAQMATSFGTKMRANFETSFIFRIENQYESKWCYEMFNAGACKSLEIWNEVLLNITKVKHQCMVVVKGAPSHKRIFRLLAPPPPDFKNGEKAEFVVGTQEAIFHHLFYKEDEVNNPWINVYRGIMGKTGQEDKNQVTEFSQSLGKRGTLTITEKPRNQEINKLGSSLSVVPIAAALPRPPPAGSGSGSGQAAYRVGSLTPAIPAPTGGIEPGSGGGINNQNKTGGGGGNVLQLPMPNSLSPLL